LVTQIQLLARTSSLPGGSACDGMGWIMPAGPGRARPLFLARLAGKAPGSVGLEPADLAGAGPGHGGEQLAVGVGNPQRGVAELDPE
jgi:hypothetical protein